MNTAYKNLVDLLGEPDKSVPSDSGGRRYSWRNGDDGLWLDVLANGQEYRVQAIWPLVDSFVSVRIDGLSDIQKRAAILSIVCMLVPPPHKGGTS